MIDLKLRIFGYDFYYKDNRYGQGILIPPDANLFDIKYYNALIEAQRFWKYILALKKIHHFKSGVDPGSLSIVECQSILESFEHLKEQNYFTIRPEVIEYSKTVDRRLKALERRELGSNVKNYAGYVYLIKSPTGAYKIGRTAHPEDRLRTFNVKLPFEVEFICLIKTDDMVWLEKDLHDKYASKHINGEWYKLAKRDVEYIKSLRINNGV